MLWHPRAARVRSLRLQWNRLFWLVIALMVGMAAIFALGAELKRAGRWVGKTATLADGDKVRVVLILNGDELEVERDGARATVRMIGIRSFDPVVNEREITAFGEASVNFLQHLVLNQEVRLVFDTPVKDVRGRYLAYLQFDDIDVNQHMLDEGLSMVYTEYPFAREQAYLTAESLARRHGRGIWGGHKAQLRILALRNDWASARQERLGHTAPDPLLGERP